MLYEVVTGLTNSMIKSKKRGRWQKDWKFVVRYRGNGGSGGSGDGDGGGRGDGGEKIQGGGVERGSRWILYSSFQLLLWATVAVADAFPHDFYGENAAIRH